MRRTKLKFIHLACFWFIKFKNSFIFSGKKQKIERVVKNIFIELKLKFRCLPLVFLYEIVEELKSPFKLAPFRRGKKFFILPRYISRFKQHKNGLYWFVKNIKNKKKKNSKVSIKVIIRDQFEGPIVFRTTDLLLDENSGNLKLVTYKTIADNRVNLHYRW